MLFQRWSTHPFRRLFNRAPDSPMTSCGGGLEPIHYSTFSLNELLSEQIKPLAELADEKGLALEVSKKFEMKDITSDRRKLTGIINNLMANAIQYTDKGRVELYVSTFQKRSRDRWFQFEVRDTGSGISPSEKAQLFTPEDAASLHEKEKTAGSGSGLGLVMTKHFVSLLGGEIWVDSEEGQGSIFIVSIPSYLSA